jgi:hypothetical protein
MLFAVTWLRSDRVDGAGHTATAVALGGAFVYRCLSCGASRPTTVWRVFKFARSLLAGSSSRSRRRARLTGEHLIQYPECWDGARRAGPVAYRIVPVWSTTYVSGSPT